MGKRTMAYESPQHHWATQDDWDAHRETISRLYWDESRPLPEVMDIMRSRHDFHATYVRTRTKSFTLPIPLNPEE